MKTKTVELNGKRYDAITGRLLGDTSAQLVSMKGNPMLDIIAPSGGIRRRSVSSGTDNVKVLQPHHKVMDIRRGIPHNLAAHQPQRAKTLMRQAVQHPSKSFKRQTNVASHTGALVKNPQITVTPKHAATIIDEHRRQRAQQVRPSKLVRHFNTPQRGTSLRPASNSTRVAVGTRPKSAASALAPVRPAQATPVNTRTAPSAAPLKQRSIDIFERALAQATSHTQPSFPIKRNAKRSHRLRTVLSIAGFSLIALLIVGFVVYQNTTNIQLRFASSRAGIHATLPAWRPSGFSLAGLAATPGSVTVHFRNAQASQSFSVTQKASSWDTNALLSDYVLPNTNASYQTIESAGSTIYTYGNNNATWVNGNIWYRLTSNGSLSTSQIVQLVASM